jgi:hypothetical protein
VLPDTPKLANISQVYMAAVEKKFRDAGIVVPSILNDAYPHGYFAPGTGPGAVDIYGTYARVQIP